MIWKGNCIVHKQKMKGWKKAVIILCGIPIVLFVLLAGLYLYADNKPDIHKDYNSKIETGREIESHYLQSGTFETDKTTAPAEKPIRKYTIYYPSALESSAQTYPMILVVNGTGGKATKYEPQFELYASWGFITVGTQDKGTGSGQTTIETLNYMLEQNENPDSIFYQKIDVENIGVTGFSQGGAAVFNAITKYEEGGYFRAAAPLSPVCERTAAAVTDYPYHSEEVNCPILMLAGTSGEFETEAVIPIADMKEMYDKMTVPKVMARRVGMTHDQMLYSAGGYVIAWFRWQLMGDVYAARVFTGDEPEIMRNPQYQDQFVDLN